MLADLALGWLLAQLFRGGRTQSPAVTLPPSSPPSTHAPTPQRRERPRGRGGSRTERPTQPNAPETIPASAPAATPAFPTQVSVPPGNAPAPGMKKAVEVWAIRPDVAALKDNPFVVGRVGAVNEATAVAALETKFPSGWAAATRVTADERAMAVSLLNKWKKGGVIFLGPATLTGRRAFRMTEHPKETSPATAAPAPVPAPAAPAAPPAAAPAASAPAALPFPPSAVQPAPTGAQVATVRKNEGLAQVGKRLGRPESQATATELRAANLPNGPDGPYTKLNLSDGGLRLASRSKGGLQPGDRLFVPASWGVVDANRL